MTRHSFDPDVAAKVGINAAVIYQNIIWWCEKNAANERNMHDGKAWTYNSMKAFERLFPYLTPKQIRVALEKLESVGMLRAGNFNANAYDRTKWYCPVEQIHLPSRANGKAPEGEPIPDSKPVDKPDVREEPDGSLPCAFSADLSKAMQRYNDAASKAGWPKIQKLTPARSKVLKTRLKECGGLDGWEAALRKAFTSDFCRGRTAKPWSGFSFDWLTKQANFTKLMEGNYDNRAGDRSNESTADFARRIAERRAARRMDRGASEGASGTLLPADHDGGS